MSEMYGIIYKATNITNDKAYIGQTILSLSERRGRHIADISRLNTYFSRALKKYGPENFRWEIVSKCYSAEELNNIEIEMIEKYDTFGNGYNLTKGGEGNVGFKYTKESKKKLSEGKKGEKNPMYGKFGKDHHNYGKPRSEETKKKISEATKAERNHNYGKHITEAVKKKMAFMQIGSDHPLAKKYIIITPESEEIPIHGIAEFCRNYEKEKLDYHCLVKTAQGKQRYHKGYRCKYL